MDNIKSTQTWLENAQLICTKTDGITKYDFAKFIFPLKFALRIYNHDCTLQRVENGFQVEKETDEEIDTTIMPGLESEKSAAKKETNKDKA